MASCSRNFIRIRVPIALSVMSLALVAALQTAVTAQQQPIAVVAVAGIDRVLKDIDHIFVAGGAPHHAQRIHETITSLNELRGLDRQRPVGMLLYFPMGDQTDPQPLLFFPVADIEELLNSVQFGDGARLERTDIENRLTLHTKDADLPVAVEHGFAFLDPSKSGDRLSQPLVDPAELLKGALDDHDAALIIRREGFPPALFETAAAQIRDEAEQDKRQKEEEDDSEFAIRREVSETLFSTMESVVRDWRGIVVGLDISAEDRMAQVNARVVMDWPQDQDASVQLAHSPGESIRLSRQPADSSTILLSLNWQPTQASRNVLLRIVKTFREKMAEETADADAASRETVSGVIDAMDATATEGMLDAFFRLISAGPDRFVLIGGAAVEDVEKVAAGIELLLPLAAEGKDIRSVELGVAQARGVAIHRLVPNSLRKQDRRLYGDDAAIYLAAGEGAVWMAIGGDGTVDLLRESIEAVGDERPAILDRSRNGGLPADESVAEPTFLELTIHATDWVTRVQANHEGRRARIGQLARQAFDNTDEDTLTLNLHRTNDGVGLRLHFDQGYVRLLGLALAAALDKEDESISK